jgi:hypothetical protein
VIIPWPGGGDASYINFPINTTTQRSIVLAGAGSKIYSNDLTDGNVGGIDVEKNFRFDMTYAVSGTLAGLSSFVVAKTKAQSILTGTPFLDNNNDELWTEPAITSVLNGGTGNYDITLTARFDPSFQLQDDSYKGWTGLLVDVNDHSGNTARLLKNISALYDEKTFGNNYTIDLQNYSITDNTNSISIGGDKTLTLGSTGSGKFSGNISFVGTTSTLKVTKAALLGAGFTISSGGSAGVIELNGVTDAIDLNNVNFNGKLRSVLVTNGSVITITKDADL